VRRRILAAVVAALLVALVVQGASLAGWLGGDDPRAMTVTADFVDTTGLYVGNDVTYLGVPIGQVVDVEPHGASMKVVMHLDPGTTIPRDAGAEILQSSLVTDRYVELGPAYTGGPTLPSGANIDVRHTRSPAGVDEIASSIDRLVKALDGTLGSGPGGSGIARMLAATAHTLRGNGGALRAALSGGQGALEVLTGKKDALARVSRELLTLVDVLARRDARIRTFTHRSDATLGVLSAQRGEIVATIRSLSQLTRLAGAFLRRNGDVLGADLKGIDQVVGIVRSHQASLGEAWDVMPAGAQNIVRAYDWKLQRMRVALTFNAGPFSGIFRNHACNALVDTLAAGLGLCDQLVRPDSTGSLDPLLDALFFDALPGAVP
jgi:phospholipid/cholesterol/gamma-HCH transport system substrate-binding protein